MSGVSAPVQLWRCPTHGLMEDQGWRTIINVGEPDQTVHVCRIEIGDDESCGFELEHAGSYVREVAA